MYNKQYTMSLYVLVQMTTHVTDCTQWNHATSGDVYTRELNSCCFCPSSFHNNKRAQNQQVGGAITTPYYILHAGVKLPPTGHQTHATYAKIRLRLSLFFEPTTILAISSTFVHVQYTHTESCINEVLALKGGNRGCPLLFC